MAYFQILCFGLNFLICSGLFYFVFIYLIRKKTNCMAGVVVLFSFSLFNTEVLKPRSLSLPHSQQHQGGIRGNYYQHFGSTQQNCVPDKETLSITPFTYVRFERVFQERKSDVKLNWQLKHLSFSSSLRFDCVVSCSAAMLLEVTRGTIAQKNMDFPCGKENRWVTFAKRRALTLSQLSFLLPPPAILSRCQRETQWV